MTVTKLTPAMRAMLARVPIEWGQMPYGVGCCNGTAQALEKRGLIETRTQPGQSYHLFGFAKWDWRKVPACT